MTIPESEIRSLIDYAATADISSDPLVVDLSSAVAQLASAVSQVRDWLDVPIDQNGGGFSDLENILAEAGFPLFDRTEGEAQ